MAESLKPHELLRKYRTDNGLSCAQMGKLLGVAESTARSLENGNRSITAERAVAIELAIGIPRAELCPEVFAVAA